MNEAELRASCGEKTMPTAIMPWCSSRQASLPSSARTEEKHAQVTVRDTHKPSSVRSDDWHAVR